MSYYSTLASALRTQRQTEDTIAEVLREVRDAEASSGQSAEEIFGPAVDYAKQYPKGKKISLGGWVVNASGVVALAWVLFSFVARLHEALWPTMLVAVIIGLVGAVIGALLDRRLPAGARDRV